MTSYKANTKNDLYYIFLYVAIIVGSVAFSKKPVLALYAGGIFIPLIAGYQLFVSRLNEIKIDKKKDTLTVIYRNYLKRKKEQVFDLSNIEYTYKRNDAVKADKNKVACTLYYSGKEIVKLKHDKDGWTSDQLFDLVYELKGLGVKRKFTGYMMKDAEV